MTSGGGSPAYWSTIPPDLCCSCCVSLTFLKSSCSWLGPSPPALLPSETQCASPVRLCHPAQSAFNCQHCRGFPVAKHLMLYLTTVSRFIFRAKIPEECIAAAFSMFFTCSGMCSLTARDVMQGHLFMDGQRCHAMAYVHRWREMSCNGVCSDGERRHATVYVHLWREMSCNGKC